MNRYHGRWSSYLFALPFLVLFGLFVLWPIGYGLYLSVMRYELTAPQLSEFVSFNNYAEAFGDRYFWKAASVTLGYVVVVSSITVIIALILAMGIDRVNGRLQHLYRMAVFVPTVLTVSVAALLWRWLLNSEFGVFNALLSHVGWELPWLTSPTLAFVSICLMTIWWGLGVPTMIILAGLQNIPESQYEAAMIDGANGLQVIRYITLPFLRPVLVLALTLNIIATFQIFGQTYLITGGGPELSTRPLMQYIYEIGFGTYRIGYASAMSWLLFLLIGVCVIIQRWAGTQEKA